MGSHTKNMHVLPKIVTVLAVLAMPSRSVEPSARPPVDPLAATKALYKRPAAVASALQADPVFDLGQRLFFDPHLSQSNSLACAGCHRPDSSWADHRAQAQGEGSEPLAFRVPTLLNAGTIERYGWTGRFPDIETVSFFAMTSPANMNLTEADLSARLVADPGYVEAFKTAFPDGAISRHNIGTALTRYVGAITSGEAPFDLWIAGDETAIGDDAKRGFALFNGKAQCAACHIGWTFTDGSFHDIGTATGDDIGRGQFFKTSVKLRYAFKTPTLRDVADRAPYTHNGAVATLSDMIDLYDRGGIDRPSRAEAIAPLHLTAVEKADLLAFLSTLSGPTEFSAR